MTALEVSSPIAHCSHATLHSTAPPHNGTTGGRAPEYLSMDDNVLALVRHFFAAGKPVASICHGQIILAAAGVLQGRSCTCYPAVQPTVEAAGATFVTPDPITMCVTDKNLVSGAAWPGHPEFLKQFAVLLGTSFKL
jgi:D-lactate dehydratase